MLCSQYKPWCPHKSVKLLYIVFLALLAACAVCQIRNIEQALMIGKYNCILKVLSKCISEMQYKSLTNLKRSSTNMNVTNTVVCCTDTMR